MVFKYKGIDAQAKKVVGKIEAPTVQEAKARLKGQGILFEYVKPSQNSWLKKLQGLHRAKIPTTELSNFSRNLSIYLKAGMPLLKAIRLLQASSSNRVLSDFCIAIATMIEEGKSFYGAIEAQKVATIPSFYRHSIKVAESNGLLGLVLMELASFLKKEQMMVKQMKKALTYPAFIMIISFIMVGVMLVVVVPRITGMLEQMNKVTPPLTQFVIDAADFVGNFWVFIIIGLFGLVALFQTAKKSSHLFALRVDRFMLRVPLFGKLARTSELARFCYTSSMLMKAGVPFVHTVRLSANTLNNVYIKSMFEEASGYVVEGKKFSQSLAKANFRLDKQFIQAVSLGEETSELANMLENLSDLYDEEHKDLTDAFLALIEPMLILFVGVIMGVIVAAMLLPIFSLNMME